MVASRNKNNERHTPPSQVEPRFPLRSSKNRKERNVANDPCAVRSALKTPSQSYELTARERSGSQMYTQLYVAAHRFGFITVLKIWHGMFLPIVKFFFTDIYFWYTSFKNYSKPFRIIFVQPVHIVFCSAEKK